MGTSYYIGDLNDNHFELAQPALGLIYRNNLNRRFTLKASAWAGEIRGNDKINNIDTAKIIRNLHFRSPIMELSGQIEFNFFEYETGSKRYPFSPFIFAGISFLNTTHKQEGGIQKIHLIEMDMEAMNGLNYNH